MDIKYKEVDAGEIRETVRGGRANSPYIKLVREFASNPVMAIEIETDTNGNPLDDVSAKVVYQNLANAIKRLTYTEYIKVKKRGDKVYLVYVGDTEE